MEEKKNLLTREGIQKYEEELAHLKETRRKDIAEKLNVSVDTVYHSDGWKNRNL